MGQRAGRESCVSSRAEHQQTHVLPCRDNHPTGLVIAGVLQGADTVIYERLARLHPLNDKLKEVTLQHMEEFGSAGLRTLCLAYKELDAQVYDE